jgi:hypothetical protein
MLSWRHRLEQFEIYEILGALLIGAGTAIAALVFWTKTNSRTAVVGRTLMQEAEDTITFLFENEVLVDVTPRAH